jgi:branched-chain amino acid transport system ATP-binding protein
MLLDVRNLSVRFGGLRALDDISFGVGDGEIVGLVGPNGAGKSTLVNAVSGTLPRSRGQILFCGQDVTGWSPSRIAGLGLARTFQLVQPFRGLTALECVTLGALYGSTAKRPSGVAAARGFAETALDLCGLTASADSPCDALNASQRRRLEIARALAARPRLVLLDEALSGMNSSELEAGIALVRSIRARGISILMIEHMVRVVAELADRIVVLDHGEMIANGPAAAVLADRRAVDVYFGPNPLQAGA